MDLANEALDRAPTVRISCSAKRERDWLSNTAPYVYKSCLTPRKNSSKSPLLLVQVNGIRLSLYTFIQHT